VNSLDTLSNSTYFTGIAGYNSRSYYDPDYATTAVCSTVANGGIVPDIQPGTAITRRKYGCRYTTYSGTPTFIQTQVTGQAAALNGGRASGTLSITDTTLVGTLTIQPQGDEPVGGTITTTATGARINNTPGVGAAGYNYRSADGSPFGNYWQGISTSGTLSVNLTGTFNETDWNITGGVVSFFDAGYACQQGGLGATIDSAAGTLCTRGTAAGSQQNNGQHLSWGWDLDGANNGTSAITQLDVRDAAGAATLATLSGVLASLTVNPGLVSGSRLVDGLLSTNSAEYRRGLGSTGGGCANHIRWTGSTIACGTLTAGRLEITGTVNAVPVPAAAFLVAPAILAGAAFARRRRQA
jgi:hypothetical protein